METKKESTFLPLFTQIQLENISVLEFMECHYRKIICIRPKSSIENNCRIIWIVISKKINFYITKVSLSSNQLSLFWKDHSSDKILAAEGWLLASSDIIFSWMISPFMLLCLLGVCLGFLFLGVQDF